MLRNILCLINIFILGVTVLSCQCHAESIDDYKNQALKFYQKKDYQNAVEVTKKALKLAQQQFGEDSLQAAEFLGNLGGLYLLQNKTKEGQELLKKARSIRDKNQVTGISLGVQSEAFFDMVDRRRELSERNWMQEKFIHELIPGISLILVGLLALVIIRLKK